MSKKQEMFTPNEESADLPVTDENTVAPVEESAPEPQPKPTKGGMLLEVFEFYQGRATNEIPIVPAVYDPEDPALFGLADYLVEFGAARWLKVRG